MSRLNAVQNAEPIQANESVSLKISQADDTSLAFSSEKDGDDDDEEFVTISEFTAFKEQMKQQFNHVQESYHEAVNSNVDMVAKLDTVDWSLINKCETKLAEVLGEFQLTVDGLMMTIEADIKRWKTQHTELTAKYEAM